MKFLVYSNHINERLRYAAGFVLCAVSHEEPLLTDDRKMALNHKGPIINYHVTALEGSFHIVPAGLIHSSGTDSPEPPIGRDKDVPLLFPVKTGNIGFDIFSAVFYMLSRMEEYQDFQPDRHGRFPAAQSLASRQGFLQIPVVDHWCLMLQQKLRDFFPGFEPPEFNFKFRPGIDIDIAWAYRNKGFLKQAGGLAKCILKGRFSEASWRIQTWMGGRKDPFDSYELIRNLHNSNLNVFFLAGSGRKWDLNNPVSNRHWMNLVADFSKRFRVGLHPSYHCFENPALLLKEKHLLEKITGQTIVRNRFHFLRFSFPSSFRLLMEAGITDDFSLGFPDAMGFRAGTARSFLFYDLEKESITGLKLHPFSLMDRCLKDHLGMVPGKTGQFISGLRNTIASTGGCLSVVWHNDSLAGEGEWKGWREVYLEMLKIMNGGDAS